MKPLKFYGDSITAGVPVTPAYPGLLATALGVSISANHAASGNQAADQSYKALKLGPDSSSDVCIMLGVNDVYQWGNVPAKISAFKKFLMSVIVRATCPDIKITRVSGVTTSGTWYPYGLDASDIYGKYTQQVGATATATVSGTAVYIGIRSQNTAGTGGTFEVKIDGVSKGTFSPDGTQHGTTGSGLIAATMVYRVSGLSAGSHTVLITHQSGQTMLDYIAGSGQSTFINAFVGNSTPVPASTSTVTAYNAAISELVSELHGDGLSVFAVNSNAAVNPSTGMYDAVHPNAASHVAIKDAFKTVIETFYGVGEPPEEPEEPPVCEGFTGTKTYSSTVTYLDGEITNISFEED